MAYAVGHRVAVALPVMLNYTALQCESLASPARARVRRSRLPFHTRNGQRRALLVPHVPPRTDEPRFQYTTSNSGVRTHS